MKLLGHPVHPLFIHFPTALLPMDLVLSVLYHATGNQSFYHAGFYCLAGGVLAGLPAILSGLIELITMPKGNKHAITLALYHGCMNGTILLLFAIICYKAWKIFPEIYLASTNGIFVKAFLVIALFAGNYMGGKLIYKHHIGINPKKSLHGEMET